MEGSNTHALYYDEALRIRWTNLISIMFVNVL